MRSDRYLIHDPESQQPIAVTPNAFALAGKHIVVTGGGRGIGQGIAISVALAGATVTVMARSTEQLDKTVRLAAEHGGACIAHQADLADVTAIPEHVALIDDRLPIDGVVHSAGAQARRQAVDITMEDWRSVQTVNLEAPFFLSAAVAKRQLEGNRTGSHLFIASLTSTIGPAGMAPYVASKSGLAGLTRALSTEWSPEGIRANSLGVGYIHTALTDPVLSLPDYRTRILSRIPMGRFGTPADLGGISVFLLSDASSYVSGQLINIDGGWLAA